ncbi:MULTISPECIES: hypothetical protein [unclassified Microcoleus]|jgi:hypothetical protein|uniref:hypothetical protein n=1 Tax=unclassified Microcoleus TaxID=2642155 RepID=UPI002FCFD513
MSARSTVKKLVSQKLVRSTDLVSAPKLRTPSPHYKQLEVNIVSNNLYLKKHYGWQIR